MSLRRHLFSLLLFLGFCTCRKDSSPTPATVAPPPSNDTVSPVNYHFAERLIGPYVWRNRDKRSLGEIWSNENADQDIIYLSGGTYKFRDITGAVVTFSVSKEKKVLFDTSTGRLVWIRSNSDTLFSIMGQRERWKSVLEKLEELKWYSRRIEMVAPDPWGYIAYPPDTLANILELFKRYAPGKSSYGSGPQLLGVDSAYAEYEDKYYDHGPSYWRVSGRLFYFPLKDSASMEVYPMQLGDSKYDFHTR